MDMDLSTCSKRNVHNRTEAEISKIIEGWEKTPLTHLLLDTRSLLQSAAITEVSGRLDPSGITEVDRRVITNY